MKILITGAAGNLGKQLAQQLKPNHDIIGVDIVGDNIQQLDITDYTACQTLMQSIQPDIVLHPAAWTDVNGCAHDPQKAILINGVGTHNIAVVSAQQNIPILYVSSNEVFDGMLNRPYTEFDVTNPINPYAYSKWYGERAVQQINPKHYIVRTAWLFAHGGNNFIQAILNAVKAGKSLRVVTNEVANPTYNNDLAEAIAKLINTERYGIYHMVNQGAVSRWDFARYFLDQCGYRSTEIARISRHEWQRPSLPPEYTPLANIAGASIGITLRSWQTAVDAFLDAEGLV